MKGTISPGWTLPAGTCEGCERELVATAILDAGIWELYLDCPNECGEPITADDRWPFVEPEAEAVDMVAVGFEVIP